MGFTFEPRALLEMGKELISSDEVALYELIKNSVDAGSPRIEINFDIHLKYRDFIEARSRLLSREYSVKDVYDFISTSIIDPQNPKSSAFLKSFNLDGDKEQFLKILDDAYHEVAQIEVRDSGHGMSLEDLNDVFLRIGTKSKHIENLNGGKKLGDKGIGRLSAMRLGNRLRVKTTKSGEKYWNILDIDWTEFSHESTKRIEDIHIEPYRGDIKEDSTHSGTHIIISGLEKNWEKGSFAEIFHGPIARMVDPFMDRRENRGLIAASYNENRVAIPSISKKLLDQAHLTCRISFDTEGDEPRLHGFISDQIHNKLMEIDLSGAEIMSLAQKSVKKYDIQRSKADILVPLNRYVLQKLGGFTCDLYYYDKYIVDEVNKMSSYDIIKNSEIKDWSGGPMLYRNGFRILPYGNPDNDWLGLDEVSSNKDFSLNRHQIIGRVEINAPHMALNEQTNREGLVESDEFHLLRNILKWVIDSKIYGFMSEINQSEKIKQQKARKDMRENFDGRIQARAIFDKIRHDFPKSAEENIEKLEFALKKIDEEFKALESHIDIMGREAKQEKEKFLHLAGIGMINEIIFHEIGQTIFHIQYMIDEVKKQGLNVESLEMNLRGIESRIKYFSVIGLNRTGYTDRINLPSLVNDALSQYEDDFNKNRIHISMKKPDDAFLINGSKGMMIQILENLMMNSIYWLKQQKRIDARFFPKIDIVLDKEKNRLTFEDNGPGIPLEHRERVFQPFMTTKPSGEGRGLGLHICRDLAKYHGWNFSMDDKEGDIRKGRVNKFILSFDPPKPTHDYEMLNNKSKAKETENEFSL